MPIGKGRERKRRARRGAERDLGATEAYEHGWYSLLARQASGDGAVGPDESATVVEDGVESPRAEDREDPAGAVGERLTTIRSEHLATLEPEHLASVTSLVTNGRVSIELKPARPGADGGQTPSPTSAPDTGRRPADRRPLRIGVRRLADPESVYLRYLTASEHRDFYRAGWWPPSSTITPSHLWRANHIGAGWTLDEVRRFMDGAAELADVLVAGAPNAARPGSPERRAWIDRFLSAEWVRDFGIGRVAKTLLPVLPELVPDLDPVLLPWVTNSWLGVDPSPDADEAGRSLESWELLEDVLILRGQDLGLIVRRLRRLTPGIAPVGRLGLLTAAFWDSFWSEAPDASTKPRPQTPRRKTAAAIPTGRAPSRAPRTKRS